MKKLFTFIIACSILITPVFAVTFSDVPASRSDYQAIGYFAQEGYVGGYSDGTFQPDRTINRVEALKIILNILGVDATSYDPLATKDFPDTNKNDWFYPFVQFAVQRGIVAGTDAGLLEPGRPVNRVEFFKLLFAAYELYTSSRGEVEAIDVDTTAWYIPYLHLATQTGLLALQNGKYEPGRSMTRGEVVETSYQFLQRKDLILTQAELNKVEDHVLDTIALIGARRMDEAVDLAGQTVAVAENAKDRLPDEIATETAYNLAMAVKYLAAAKSAPENIAGNVNKSLSYLRLVKETTSYPEGTIKLIEQALNELVKK